jgi:hypothetical protein
MPLCQDTINARHAYLRQVNASWGLLARELERIADEETPHFKPTRYQSATVRPA